METKEIKSARRVLEVFEFFGADNREASVMDIARSLNYPQSSTSELLHFLAAIGYLTYDRHARTFRPTARVALLGAWVQPSLFRNGSLLQMMDELSRATGETIVLGTRVGLLVQYIHVLPATNPVRLHVPSGSTRPLARSGIGKLLLSTESDDAVSDVIRRINSDARPSERVRLPGLLEEISRIRSQGYSLSLNAFTRGSGIVASLIPVKGEDEPLAVGIGGVADVVSNNRDRFLRLLRASIARHLDRSSAETPATRLAG
jgi:DNA-binding IclR family transcriptional regulator